MTGKKTVLRKHKDKVKYAALLYRIGQLEGQLTALYPSMPHPHYPEWQVTPFQDKRPDKQAYSVDWDWRDRDEQDAESTVKGLRRMAEHLKNVRADIRALSPPEDETKDVQIAA